MSQYITKSGSAVTGYNYKQTPNVASLQSCMALCSADSSCVAGTLRDDGICALHAKIYSGPLWDNTPNNFQGGFYLNTQFT